MDDKDNNMSKYLRISLPDLLVYGGLNGPLKRRDTVILKTKKLIDKHKYLSKN